MKYLALLRGINVGGKSKVSMVQLRACFESLGYRHVRTYINSGNVIFETAATNTSKLRTEIEACLKSEFGFELQIVLLDSMRYKKAIDSAPHWWGRDSSWKHNALFLIEPYDVGEVVAAVGDLKPSIEALYPGDGVLFQSLEFSKFGQTTTGKLASNPIYKKITIRNYNTTQKLLQLLTADET